MRSDRDANRWWRPAFVGMMVVIAAAHLRALSTENVNWDEFALLQRAESAARTGVLSGGGRPGLGTLFLVPFARSCTNATEALLDARLLWVLFVFGGAAAFFLLLRAALPTARWRDAAAATGLALWVLAPAYLRFSIQVRTDQPAVFFGLWGGVALLASRRRWWMAAPAGILFGIGFFFSQKLAYVGALMIALAVAQHLIRSDFQVRREALRAVLAGTVFLGTLVLYRTILGLAAEAPDLVPVAGAMNTFAYYREVYGWVYYRHMLPTLIPQLVVLAALVPLTASVLRGTDRTGWREVASCWLVVLVGGAVAGFHAARFPYFYMVLGLFPAAAGALMIGPLLDRLRHRWRIALFAPLATILLLLALAQSALLTSDSASHQRASVAFVEESFPAGERGFDGLGIFTCRHDPDPFPVRFRQHLHAENQVDSGAALSRALIEEFRTRPVTFMIPPGNLYPSTFQDFWQARYIQYWESIWIPGRRVRGARGTRHTFDVLVAGTYRWTGDGAEAPMLEVAGRTLEPSDTLFLAAGRHELRQLGTGSGRLHLSLARPPRPASRLFFTEF